MMIQFLRRIGVLAMGMCEALAFSWRPGGYPGQGRHSVEIPVEDTSLLARNRRNYPKIYETALQELAELDLEPVCHRIAARLLIHNYELIDGKDEVMVHTESGRKVRDFVDSYAASLAICDLERGNFKIPLACNKFRDYELARLPSTGDALLHVKSGEIDMCLTALAVSDSAWNTWVSYRHKAVRFCEAARADNEKAQSVHLYQRLTKVIADLTHGVELELQRRMAELDARLHQTTGGIESLQPLVERLKSGLADATSAEKVLLQRIEEATRKSSESIEQSSAHAIDTITFLSETIQKIIESNAQHLEKSENSLEIFNTRAGQELGTFLSAVAVATTATAILQTQLDITTQKTSVLAERQAAVEEGLQKLVVTSEALATGHAHSAEALREAQNATSDILRVLEEASKSAGRVRTTLLSKLEGAGWWPHFIYPAASLVMGSYGLPPSLLRNFGLVAFGEAVGLVVAWAKRGFGAAVLSIVDAETADEAECLDVRHANRTTVHTWHSLLSRT